MSESTTTLTTTQLPTLMAESGTTSTLRGTESDGEVETTTTPSTTTTPTLIAESSTALILHTFDPYEGVKYNFDDYTVIEYNVDITRLLTFLMESRELDNNGF